MKEIKREAEKSTPLPDLLHDDIEGAGHGSVLVAKREVAEVDVDLEAELAIGPPKDGNMVILILDPV